MAVSTWRVYYTVHAAANETLSTVRIPSSLTTPYTTQLIYIA